MLVRELMTTPAVTVAPETTVREAAALLSERGITAMPVVDERGELLGVVSEADLILEAFLPDPRAHERPVDIDAGAPMARVGQVMTRHVLTVPARADLAAAADLMVGTAVKSLPVVEENRVVGVLSRKDLVDTLARRDDEIADAVNGLLRSSEYDWTAEVRDGVAAVTGPADERETELARVLVATVPGVLGVTFPLASAR